MKKVLIAGVMIVLIGGAAVFLALPFIKGTSEEDIRMNLVEAQRFLDLMRRVESAKIKTNSNELVETAAIKKGRRFVYSDSWDAIGLPPVRPGLGFNFRCSKDGLCRAMEVRGGLETGNGIGCDVETGAYQCFGEFLPVMTSGFGGAEIIVGCDAPSE